MLRALTVLFERFLRVKPVLKLFKTVVKLALMDVFRTTC